MTKITCEVVQDLLPLYYDEVCSDDTKKLVEAHLESCHFCKSELAALATEIPIKQSEASRNEQDKKMVLSLANSWNTFRKKAFLKGVGIASIIALILFGGYYGLMQWDVMPVKKSTIALSEVSQLTDGRIAYHVDFLDDYDIYRVKYELDENGNFYMIPLRTVIKQSSLPHFVVGEGYHDFDLVNQQLDREVKIKALYYGSKNDAQLIWKQGTELPKASAEVEMQLKINR